MPTRRIVTSAPVVVMKNWAVKFLGREQNDKPSFSPWILNSPLSSTPGARPRPSVPEPSDQRGQGFMLEKVWGGQAVNPSGIPVPVLFFTCCGTEQYLCLSVPFFLCLENGANEDLLNPFHQGHKSQT